MAISLVSKMFGSGLQVDRGSSSNKAKANISQVIHIAHHPFLVLGKTWKIKDH